MNKQEVSTLLEIFSFFFIGIDLYGTDRLKRMQASILSISEKINQRISGLKGQQWSKHGRSRFMIIIYMLIVMFEIYFMINTIIESQPESWAVVFKMVLLGLILGFFAFFVLLLPALFAIAIGLLFLIGLIELMNLIIRLFIWTFRFYQIEGLFLFIGTVLFLLSKYYQLY